MSFFVNVSGMEAIGLKECGGEEEYYAQLEGKDPPLCLYKPRIANVAPRTDGNWAPARSNTQTPPLSGPNKDQKPAQQQPRAPLFTEIRKVTP